MSIQALLAGLACRLCCGVFTLIRALAFIASGETEGGGFCGERSSAQQQQMMEFLMHDRDEAAMGPQLLQKEACEPGNNVLQQLVSPPLICSHVISPACHV